MGRRIGVGLCLAILAGGCGESTSEGQGTARGGNGDGGSSRAGSASAGIGGAAGSASGGSAGRPGGGGGSGGSGEFFVEGRVDGELVRIEVGVQAFWFQGLLEGYLSVQGLVDELGWVINVPNYDGADTCGTATITLTQADGADTVYYLSDPYVGMEVGCSLFVEHAAPNVGDVIEGTFSGELGRIPGGPDDRVSVTEGAFRAPRTADGSSP
ncbi:MAG TPA: hypothetical protein VFZ53_24625 [Polyangiaceae bacterium]